MNIPRKNTQQVKDILETITISNRQKAEKIHDFDYDCCLRASPKPVNRWDLMSIEQIEKELNNDTL